MESSWMCPGDSASEPVFICSALIHPNSAEAHVTVWKCPAIQRLLQLKLSAVNR